MSRASSRPLPAAHLLAVGLGGALGTALRGALAETADPSHGWPWATFLANTAGTILLVVLLMRAPRLMALHRPWRAALGAGLCGGLTTFSLFQIELVRFLKDGRVLLAVGYAAASVLVALTVVLAVPAKRA